MNSEPPSDKKRRLTLEAKVALVFGIISLTLSILASLAFYINWGIPPGMDIKGPHPWIASIGHYLDIGGFYGCLASFLVSFIALVTGFFNKPRLLNVAAGYLSLIIAYAAGMTFLTTLARKRQAAREISCFNLNALGYTLKKFGKEHYDQIPHTINWCDELIEFDSYSSNEMRRGWVKNDEGLSEFAFNTKLSDMKLAETPKDVVLLFETKLAKNPAGGPELINAENISSYEVEKIVEKFPAVLEAAAYAIKSDLGEDDVMVAVIPRPGVKLDPRELYDFCAREMPRYMIPRYIRIVSEFPKTETLRVVKTDLKAQDVTPDTWDEEKIIGRRK